LIWPGASDEGRRASRARRTGDFEALLQRARTLAQANGMPLLRAWFDVAGGDVRESTRLLSRGLRYPFLETSDLITAIPDLSESACRGPCNAIASGLWPAISAMS
jgi:hypothetical protein